MHLISIALNSYALWVGAPRKDDQDKLALSLSTDQAHCRDSLKRTQNALAFHEIRYGLDQQILRTLEANYTNKAQTDGYGRFDILQ